MILLHHYNKVLKGIKTKSFYFYQGNGFITIEVLREILRELDDKLTEDDLDNMIDEIDTDGSGTVDWDGKDVSKTRKKSLCIINLIILQNLKQ